jgi:hypothetical protein
MKTLDETLAAFEKYLENISDSKLDKMVDQIDEMGIKGPTVEEYFYKLTENVSSFFDASETSTIADVEKLFCDTRIKKSQKFEIPSSPKVYPEQAYPAEAETTQNCLYAGENQYLKAA